MKRNLTIRMILSILIVVLAATQLLASGFSYSSVFVVIAGLIIFISSYIEWREFEKNRRLGEALFLREFGAKADEVEPLPLLPVSKYYHLKEGISKKSFYIKFWSQGKVYKGIIDRENQVLHMKEPVLLPVCGDDLLAWKHVVRMHSNGKPKKTVYYDENEQLCGEEYLDENGTLKRGSWRRSKGIEVYWNPRKQVWEP